MLIIKKIKKILSEKKGFTLIEFLVAFSISSLIMVMIYKAHYSIMLQVKQLTGNAEFYESINLAFRRLDRDLSSTFYINNDTNLFFIGQSDITEATNSRLHFITVNRKPLSIVGNLNSFSPSSDITEVSYYLKKDPEYDDVYFLVRKESLLYDNNREYKDEEEINNSQKGIESILLNNVTELKFEFTRKSSWDDEWNSFDKRRYPKAVRTTIKVKNYNSNEVIFEIVSMLEMVN